MYFIYGIKLFESVIRFPEFRNKHKTCRIPALAAARTDVEMSTVPAFRQGETEHVQQTCLLLFYFYTWTAPITLLAQ